MQKSNSPQHLLKTYRLSDEFNSFCEVDVRPDGSCLFYAVTLSILLQSLNNNEQFENYFIKLFGEENINAVEQIKAMLAEYDGSPHFIDNIAANLEVLVDVNFRQRVVNYMREHEADFVPYIPENETLTERTQRMSQTKIHADEPEIAAIAQLLNIQIRIYRETDNQIILNGSPYNATAAHIVRLYHIPSLIPGENDGHYKYFIEPNFIPRGQIMNNQAQPSASTSPANSLSSASSTQPRPLPAAIEPSNSINLPTSQGDNQLLSKLTEMILLIDKIELTLRQEQNGELTQQQAQANIIECLYQMSWRSSEIPAADKVGDRYLQNLTALERARIERNWLLLDQLADTLVILEKPEHPAKLTSLLISFGIQLTEENTLLKTGDMAELKQALLNLVKQLTERQRLENNVKQIKAELEQASERQIIESLKKKKEAAIKELEEFKINAFNIPLTNFEDSIAPHLDAKLLARMDVHLSDLMQRVDLSNKQAIETFLTQDINRAAMFRIFEIVGESAKNISQCLREKVPSLPWLKEENQDNEVKEKQNSKKNLLNDFRNKIQHNRSELELIYRYEPEVFSAVCRSSTNLPKVCA